MKISRPLSLTVVGALAAGMLPVLLAVPAQAAPGTSTSLSAFDGTFTGAAGTNPTYYRWDGASAISRADLGPAGSATVTTVIDTDAAAAVWDLAGYGNLLTFGFGRVLPGESFPSGGGLWTGANPLASPEHDGDPVVFAQYNGGGPGNPVCANNRFYQGTVDNFVFGNGIECASPLDNSDQTGTVDGGTLRVTVTIHGDGTYAGGLVHLDSDGDVVTHFSGGHDDQQFSGTLPGDVNTKFAPLLRVRAGVTTLDPWQFTIGQSNLTVNAVPVHVVNGGNISADGSSGWAVETANGGTGAFVPGTGTPPLGTGSWVMQSNAIGDKKFLHMTKVDGVPLKGRPLSDLEKLSYSTFAANGTFAPYVNIPIHSGAIDANGDNIADGAQPGVLGATGNAILVYEPVLAGGAWGTNDTIHTSGQWRVTKKVVSGGVIPLFNYKTWDQWLAIFTDGIINPTFGDIQFVIGDTSSASWAGKSGYVDAITVVTSTEAATYDLEEGFGPCPVVKDTASKTFTLTGDCMTPATLTLPDGWTLDGAGHTITGYDTPTGTDFSGAVLTNGPQADPLVQPWVSIKNLHVAGAFNVGCTNSLFGIKLNASGGSITHSTISDIRYGPGSGCQGGNSIDITNLGGASRLPVTVDDVQVTGFQKTGIRANGNVALTLTNSSVADAQLDMITASNSLQISRGARAYVFNNTIGGNDWDGDSTYSATGVLLFDAGAVTFTRNTVSGTDTDFGLYAYDDGAFASGNVAITCNVFQRDSAADSTPTPGQARDLWNTGVATDGSLAGALTLAANTVTGFATSYDGVTNEVDGPCSSGPVGDLAATGAATSVTATWTAPTGNETAPVTSYDVTLLPGGATQTVTGTTATFNGLSPAKEYSVTVTPVNPAGHGIPASTSATTGPGAATITQTSTTDTSASAQWSVPGGAYSSFHVVISDAGGPVATHDTAGDERSWTFTGLDPDSLYTITVTPFIGATAGASDSEDVTTQPDSAPAVLPGAVTGLDVEGATASVTAAWDATPDATSYLVTLLPGGTVHAVSSPTTTFSGLTPAKEYTVTVVPVNAAGSGTSASGSATTGPGAATITSTSTTDTSATAQWSVLGTAYTSFHVVISDDGVPVATKNTNGDERMWTFTGLDPDTDYAITVTPRIGGLSGASDSADVTTNPDSHAPHDAPGPVTGLGLTGTSSSLTATWTAAPGATDYEATLLPGGAVQAVNGTTATFPIVPGKEYTITVAPHNANGWGPSRSASLDTALPTVPGGLSVSGGTVSAALTWTPSTAASPVTAYTVTATPTSGSPVTLGVPAGGLTFPVTVTGLTAHTTYTFSVTATNAFGTSAAATKTLKGTNVKTTFSPAKVTYGKKSTVTGKVTDATSGAAVAGQTIYLYGRVKGTTTYVKLGAKATSAANGTFTFTIAPHVSRRYYVTSLGADRMGANSASKPVPVKATVTMSMNRTTVHALTKVTFTGSARPKVGGVISLQRLEGSTWVTKKTVTPTSAGKYIVTWTPASKVDYRWRVVVSGPSFTKAASASQVLTVI